MLEFLHLRYVAFWFHRVTDKIKFYEGGPLVKMTIIACLLAWVVIGWTFYRTRVGLIRTHDSGEKARLHRNLARLSFIAAIVSVSMIGVLLGSALYWIVRQRLS